MMGRGNAFETQQMSFVKNEMNISGAWKGKQCFLSITVSLCI